MSVKSNLARVLFCIFKQLFYNIYVGIRNKQNSHSSAWTYAIGWASVCFSIVLVTLFVILLTIFFSPAVVDSFFDNVKLVFIVIYFGVFGLFYFTLVKGRLLEKEAYLFCRGSRRAPVSVSLLYMITSMSLFLLAAFIA